MSFLRESLSLKGDIGYWMAIGMRWGGSIGRDLCLTEQGRRWGGRGVSYGHLYFPYSHPVTPVIRTHFEPHSVYAQYTQPYSHPTPDHHHHSYCSSWNSKSVSNYIFVNNWHWLFHCIGFNGSANDDEIFDTMISLMTVQKMTKGNFHLQISKVACARCRLLFKTQRWLLGQVKVIVWKDKDDRLKG